MSNSSNSSKGQGHVPPYGPDDLARLPHPRADPSIQRPQFLHPNANLTRRGAGATSGRSSPQPPSERSRGAAATSGRSSPQPPSEQSPSVSDNDNDAPRLKSSERPKAPPEPAPKGFWQTGFDYSGLINLIKGKILQVRGIPNSKMSTNHSRQRGEQRASALRRRSY